GAGMFGPPPARSPGVVTAPPAATTAEYGKYVATYGDCRGCHGPDMMGMPATSVGPAVPNPRPIVGTWTQKQFAQTMRTGVRPNGTPFTERMPWQSATKMTDDDLAALYAYLKAPAQ
ncbi:MAG: c-type cytochrome, partial [Anaerolineae bacterium]|nr:c-type cytochrome [Anaerolineae bacterium]